MKLVTVRSTMGIRPNLGERFDHPLPGVVLLIGFGIWILASLWSVVGGVLSQFTELSFALVALLAAVIGALGTVFIVVGSLWYGFFLALDLRAGIRSG